MRGRDGVAEHLSARIDTNLISDTPVAAPGVGLAICVFKVSGTSASGAAISIRGTAVPDLWEMAPGATEPFYDYDEYGLFTLPENEPLQMMNTGLNWLRANITYEIRPTGV
jgi:hypothetical protein